MTAKQKKPRRPSDTRSTGKSAKTPAGKPSRKPAGKFGRALLPPEKFHSTQKGAHGYRRADEKEDARRAQEELEKGTPSGP